jgi:hypothetical protein
MNPEKRETNEYTPEWVRPNLQNETGELTRVIEGFLGKEPSQENIRALVDVLEQSPLVELSEGDWEALENTDSFHNIIPGQIESVQTITEEYNQALTEENKRDFAKLQSGFRNGNKIECPVILRNSEGKLHLVSGNTRLMIARALSVRPKVIIGQVN